MDVDAATARREDLIESPDGLRRCAWAGLEPDYVAYHDEEWGVAVHDDVRLFEKLCLEGFQAGLSWLTILRKRPAFRTAFSGFDPDVVAGYGASEVEQLLQDTTIVRHRGKIEATINNAQRLLDLRDEVGSLDAYVWSFAPSGTRERPRTMADIPVTTPESTALARELKGRGWRFVGPTTVYAFMQAMGLVDDHLEGCWVAPRTDAGSSGG